MTVTRLGRDIVSKSDELYRPQTPNIGIVHLGIGAFHRAHQAVYTDTYMRKSGDHNWFIAGVSLRSGTVAEQLNPQDGFYTVKVSSAQGQEQQIVQSVAKVLVAPDDPQAVLSLMASPTCHIISLTVTEKGYCHDPSTGNLNVQHPDIVHDLSNLDKPKTAIGYLISALKTRFEAHIDAPTILCCDNLPENGNTTARIVTQFATRISDELVAWINENVAFPNTMVDRIVPATTPSDIDELADEAGYRDSAMVKTEAFTQWVIEDKFAGKRPHWEDAGATIVSNVDVFEKAKLRLLNGAHSSLAYAGFLSGYEFVSEVMEDKAFGRYLNILMCDEIAPTLTAPPGLELTSYTADLLARFTNPALFHKTYQIAMDGSQKLPQRLFHTIEDRLQNGESAECLCFAVASWLRYTMAFDAKGDAIEVQDPLADVLYDVQKRDFYEIDKLVKGYLGLSQIFPQTLSTNDVFEERVKYWLSYILANGVPTALDSLLLEVQDYSPQLKQQAVL